MTQSDEITQQPIELHNDCDAPDLCMEIPADVRYRIRPRQMASMKLWSVVWKL